MSYMLKHFEFAHLPAELREVSKHFHTLAHHLVNILPSNDAETTAGLRKLLEAKDCAVRAAKAGLAAAAPALQKFVVRWTDIQASGAQTQRSLNVSAISAAAAVTDVMRQAEVAKQSIANVRAELDG